MLSECKQEVLPSPAQRAAERNYFAPLVGMLCSEAEEHPDLWVALVGSGALAELAGWAEAHLKKARRPEHTCIALPARHLLLHAALPCCCTCALHKLQLLPGMQGLAWCLLWIELLLAACCQQLDRLAGSQALPVLEELHTEAVTAAAAAAAAGPGPRSRQARGGRGAERGGKSPGGSASRSSSGSSAGAGRGRGLVAELQAAAKAIWEKSPVELMVPEDWQKHAMIPPAVR